MYSTDCCHVGTVYSICSVNLGSHLHVGVHFISVTYVQGYQLNKYYTSLVATASVLC